MSWTSGLGDAHVTQLSGEPGDRAGAAYLFVQGLPGRAIRDRRIPHCQPSAAIQLIGADGAVLSRGGTTTSTLVASPVQAIAGAIPAAAPGMRIRLGTFLAEPRITCPS